MEQLFWGRIKVEKAAAWFYFRKGSKYQRLIHYLKYKGFKEIGEMTGYLFGQELKETPYYDNVDIIIPVPLHPKKLKQRGYNQSEWIAKGISKALEKPIISDNLYRLIFSNTQTKKSRYARWENVEGIFDLSKPEDFHNKHVLVVDDVVTTGSTFEACALAFQKSENVKISLVTLAIAKN